jgi:hypothetical protein
VLSSVLVIVLAVLSALPAIPAPTFLAAFAIGTAIGTPLYFTSIVITALGAIEAMRRERRTQAAHDRALQGNIVALRQAAESLPRNDPIYQAIQRVLETAASSAVPIKSEQLPKPEFRITEIGDPDDGGSGGKLYIRTIRGELTSPYAPGNLVFKAVGPNLDQESQLTVDYDPWDGSSPNAERWSFKDGAVMVRLVNARRGGYKFRVFTTDKAVPKFEWSFE